VLADLSKPAEVANLEVKEHAHELVVGKLVEAAKTVHDGGRRRSAEAKAKKEGL
jgi:hypothetical protein